MAVGILSCGTSKRIQTTAASIVGFGDSITRGAGASDTAHQWLNILATSLGAATPLNKGIDGTVLQGTGNQASNGVGRYSADLTGGNKREMCFVLYGFNDARFTGAPATTTTAFTTDFQTIITGLLAAGYTNRTIVIGSPTFMNATGYTLGAPFSGSNDAVMSAYRDCCRALAVSNGLFFADIYNLFKSNQSYIGADNIHPNDSGHAAIAATFQIAGSV